MIDPTGVGRKPPIHQQYMPDTSEYEDMNNQSDIYSVVSDFSEYDNTGWTPEPVLTETPKLFNIYGSEGQVNKMNYLPEQYDYVGEYE